MAILQTVEVKQKSTTKTLLAVLVGVLAVSFAGFMAAAMFSKNQEASQVSLLTPRATNALTTDSTNRSIAPGSLVQLAANETATFSRIGGGKYTVEFVSSVAVEQPTGCLQIHPYRAHVLYKEYNTQGTIVDSQDLTVGPCDMGWAVEILKADLPEAPRAVLTVPAKP